jgi:hypothetical protein
MLVIEVAASTVVWALQNNMFAVQSPQTMGKIPSHFKISRDIQPFLFRAWKLKKKQSNNQVVQIKMFRKKV